MNSDKQSTGGWDYVGAGKTNTTFTINGGTFARTSGNLNCGYTSSRQGTCVVTNGAAVTAPDFHTYPDSIYRQYDGTSSFNRLVQELPRSIAWCSTAGLWKCAAAGWT